MPDYPLSNIKGTEGLPTKMVKRKKISTNFEMNKLQEKYNNPEEKKGQKRSHKGYLNYGQKLSAQMSSNLDTLAKHASQMDMEEIEKKINQEISVP